jgi:hypothetical protein
MYLGGSALCESRDALLRILSVPFSAFVVLSTHRGRAADRVQNVERIFPRIRPARCVLMRKGTWGAHTYKSRAVCSLPAQSHRPRILTRHVLDQACPPRLARCLRARCADCARGARCCGRHVKALRTVGHGRRVPVHARARPVGHFGLERLRLRANYERQRKHSRVEEQLGMDRRQRCEGASARNVCVRNVGS